MDRSVSVLSSNQRASLCDHCGEIYCTCTPWWKVNKRKEFENYFVYGNLKIFNACDPLTGTLVVEQTEMWLLEWPEIYHERARCGGGQELAQKRGEINAKPPVDYVGFVFHKLQIKWTSNLSVSFQLKIKILVSFEKYSNSKCNSLSKSWNLFLLLFK